MPHSHAEAVLLTGVYGAGKSTVVADIGALLADHGESYGLLDVDWLSWFDSGTEEDSADRVALQNLNLVCRSFLDEGVRRLAIAWSIRSHEHLVAARQAVPVPVRVVRLTLEAAVVEHRLASDPTQERRQSDLQVAREWLATDRGVGLEDTTVSADQPVRQISEAVCRWLGWI